MGDELSDSRATRRGRKLDQPPAAPTGICNLADRLDVGERVRLLSGPFADMVGRLARLDGGGRVQVLLRLLGGEVAVSVARAALMPAQAA